MNALEKFNEIFWQKMNKSVENYMLYALSLVLIVSMMLLVIACLLFVVIDDFVEFLNWQYILSL